MANQYLNITVPTPTQNPVPSSDIRDHVFGGAKIDEFVTSIVNTYIDRLGSEHYTAKGLTNLVKRIVSSLGLVPFGTFENGATIENAVQALKAVDGNYYRWDGDFPKTIPPGSTPETTGGVGAGAWVNVTDLTLRENLSQKDGAGLIGGATYAQIRAYNGTFNKIDCLGRENVFDGANGAFNLDETDKTSADNGGTILIDSLGRRWKRQLESNLVSAKWFAIGDGIADDSNAMQNLFDFCAPFEWFGSVSLTKQSMNKAKYIAIGSGKFRLTKTININPFMILRGSSGSGFFDSGDGGFEIIADFDSRDGYVLDSATYDASGNRMSSLSSSGTDFDNGMFTGCPGWLLENISITVPAGRNIRGCINRNLSMQSFIRNCSLTGANIGIKTSATWGGGLYDNHIIARAYSLFNINDVTVDEQINNYLTIDSLSKPSPLDFDYPEFGVGSEAVSGMTASVYNSYARPNHINNIWEKGELGCFNINQSSMHLENYAEGVREYVFAAHTCDLDIKLGVVFCQDAKLLWATGFSEQNIRIDFSSVAPFSAVAGWGSISAIKKPIITGSSNAARLLPYGEFVDYSDIAVNGAVNIFLSDGGDDNNSGYSESQPVATLQEAIDRCQSGNNKIKISGIVGTKYNYRSGSDVTRKVMDIDSVMISGASGSEINVSESFGEIHRVPAGIRNLLINSLKINLPSLGGEYKTMFPAAGELSINIVNSIINGNSALIGSVVGFAGTTMLSVSSSTLSCVLSHVPVSSAFSWIDSAYLVDTTGGSLGGAPGKKISSQLYP
ncbi:hypothetical protein [Pectobacterium parmentieri]|uniref:tail fiber/spike domain-containing protein n=1 Tax=Pectobacterium parmentieri TaxID=1905730 RepID=UPI000F8E917D|nr:hypothetical protein [Pectobacterium parmentieri]AZS56816.1 hypothetical protein C5E18_12105 [Pectobacterium parmentieri]MBI0429660.1 hypothetical protein [Pectobacterium parmentieri]